MRRSCPFVLSFIAALAVPVFILAAPAQSAEGPLVVTSEIARQLVALGWEHPSSPAEEPVIVYSLHFVQVNAESDLDYLIVFNSPEEGQDPTPTEMRFTDDTLRWLNTPLAASDMEIGSRSARSGTVQTAWLITVGDRPVRLNLTEERVGTGAGPIRALTLALTPGSIDAGERRILTYVEFDYTSPDGSVQSAETTLWTDPSSAQLVALVTRHDDSGGSESGRYVGIYLQGTVVPAKKLPSELRLVPIADVRAFELLFPPEPVPPPGPLAIIAFGLQRDEEGRLGPHLETLLRTDSGNRIVFALSGNAARQAHRLSFDARLIEELYLVAQIASTSDVTNAQSARIGISEQTRVGVLEASATFFPVQYQLDAHQLITRPSIEVGLRYARERWDVFVEAAYAGEFQSTLGFSWYAPSQRQGLRFTWTRTAQGHTRLGCQLLAMTW